MCSLILSAVMGNSFPGTLSYFNLIYLNGGEWCQ